MIAQPLIIEVASIVALMRLSAEACGKSRGTRCLRGVSISSQPIPIVIAAHQGTRASPRMTPMATWPIVKRSKASPLVVPRRARMKAITFGGSNAASAPA